jgi:hypothetical protein
MLAFRAEFAENTNPAKNPFSGWKASVLNIYILVIRNCLEFRA